LEGKFKDGEYEGLNTAWLENGLMIIKDGKIEW